jgi:hypothetical protein
MTKPFYVLQGLDPETLRSFYEMEAVPLCIPQLLTHLGILVETFPRFEIHWDRYKGTIFIPDTYSKVLTRTMIAFGIAHCMSCDQGSVLSPIMSPGPLRDWTRRLLINEDRIPTDLHYKNVKVWARYFHVPQNLMLDFF